MDARRRGVLLVAAAALLWSTGGIGIKAVTEPALKVTFYRSLFAAIALMHFLPRDAWATRRWTSTAAFVGSIISYAACLTTFVVATKWTTAANASVLQYARAIWALLCSPLGILIFLGAFQIALAYFLFTRGLAYVTATQASLTGMLEPIANPIWVFLFLGERPSIFAIAGAVVVLSAIAWHTLSGEPVAEIPPPD